MPNYYLYAKRRSLGGLQRDQEGARPMNTAYTVKEDLPLKMGKKSQAIDMETLYSKEQRPIWAGGTY